MLTRTSTRLAATAAILGLAAGTLAVAPSAGAAIPAPHETQLVSATADGKSPGDKAATSPSVSADGRYVVFESRATNLSTVPSTGSNQVYLRDMQTGVTQMISSQGGVEGNDLSLTPTISADGSTIAFATAATNLGVPVPSRTRQIVVWTRGVDGLRLASSGNGTTTPGNGTSSAPALSRDGSVVAFESTSSNLTTESVMGVQQVFVRNLASSTTSLASIDLRSPTPAGGPQPAVSPSLSADGRSVAFVTAATLTASPTSGHAQAYLRDLSVGTTALVSLDDSETSAAAEDVYSVSLSGDGTRLVFDTAARNLTNEPEPLSGPHVFLRDVRAGSTELISRDEFGGVKNASAPFIAASGTVASFSSPLSGVTAGLYTATDQIFVRNLTTSDTTLVSHAEGEGGGALPGNATPIRASLSADGTFAVFTMMATNLVKGVSSFTTQVYASDVTDAASVTRVSGADRYAAAAAAARRLFTADSFSFIYVASGEGYPDALSAAAAAAATRQVGAPVLLVRRDTVPSDVAAEIVREGPRNVIIIGGPNTVSPAVADELQRITGKAPIRIDGIDRFAVSAATSAFAFQPGVSVAYVASGETFPDALAAGAAAGRGGGPVLLTQRTTLSTDVEAELRRLTPARIVVLGGTSTVDPTVLDQLSAIAPTSRVSGSNRYTTAIEASKSVFTGRTRTVYISSGEVFPDALSASAAAAASRGPLLLVQKDSIPAGVDEELRRLDARKIVVVGGPNTVSDGVLNTLRSFLRSE